MTAKSVHIDPVALQSASISGKSKASATGSTFGDIMTGIGHLSQLGGEITYQATGNSNAAAVLSASFNAAGHLAAQGRGGSVGGGLPGIYGAGRHSIGHGNLPLGGGSVPGMEGMDQAQLIEQMNVNNLQLLELQAVMQNNMQAWTTKSNVVKAMHDAKMSMINKFAPQG